MQYNIMDSEDLFDPSTVPYLRLEDVCEDLQKRVIREGSEPIPEDVTIIWAMKEGRTTSGHSFQKYSSFVYKLNRKGTCTYNLCEHHLFETMKRGEECWALVPPSMHQIGEHIGASLWFRLYVEEFLEDIPETIPSQWGFLERKELTLQCVQIANRLFHSAKFNHAAPLYNRAIQALQMRKDQLMQLAAEDKAFIESTSERCWRNTAVTELKASVLCNKEKERLAKYASVISSCKKVLTKVPQDSKALYLMAKAYMLREEFNESRKIIGSCSLPVSEDMTRLAEEITRREQYTQLIAKAKMKHIFDSKVWEAEETKEKEFAQEMERKERLDERIAGQERRAAKESFAKSAMEATIEKAQKGFVIDLHEPGDEGEKMLNMMESLGEPEESVGEPKESVGEPIESVDKPEEDNAWEVET